MTLSTFLRLYGTVTIGILLLTQLEVPFGSLRDWMQNGPYVAKSTNMEGRYAAIDGNNMSAYDSVWQARWKIGPLQLLRSTVGAALACAWCTGGWVALFFACVFVDGSAWDRLCWWPALWFAASASVVIMDRVAE